MKKAATAKLYREFAEYLDDVWSMNEEFVGERVREAEVYLCLTGQDSTLRRRLVNWCRSYIDHRLKQEEPSDQGDPCLTWVRINDELARALSFHAQHNTINYIFFHEAQHFALWYLSQRTVEPLVRIAPGGGIEYSSSYRPRDPGLSRQLVTKISKSVFGRDRLARFIDRVRSSADRDEIAEIGGRDWSVVEEELGQMTTDLQEMRPYLVRDYDPATSLIDIGRRFFLAWDWSIGYGVANILGGPSEDELRESLVASRMGVGAKLSRAGRLLDYENPWIQAGCTDSPVERAGLAENYYVLKRFHEKLFGLFDRIDFDAIRRKAKGLSELPACEPEGVSAADSDEIFTLSCRDLAEKVAEGPPAPRRRIGMLRIKDMLRCLTRSFGCDVRQGKGSEVNVYRPGAKQYRLGCHGPNPEVPSAVVRRLLRRLDIPEREWLRVVYD